MQKFLVSIYFWDNPKLVSGEIDLKEGDQVVVVLDQILEVGEVKMIDVQSREKIQGKISRIATERDKKKSVEFEKEKKEILNFCRESAKNLQLNMKFIDAKESLDGKQITFAFSADSRVDFRELVKILSGKFKKSVKMQQEL